MQSRCIYFPLWQSSGNLTDCHSFTMEFATMKKKLYVAACAALIPLIFGLYLSTSKEAVADVLPAAGFTRASYTAVDGVAEIITATPDGTTLVYTSATNGKIGFVNINNPEQPTYIRDLNVQTGGVGEPTSLAITTDGRFVIIAIRMEDNVLNANPGLLRVYNIENLDAISLVKEISVGIGPDSISLAGSGTTLRAVVAIEDEETKDNGDASIPGIRPGRIDIVGLQDLYGGTNSGVQSIELVDALTTLGAPYAADPQPEFVAINHNTQLAAITLQENNAIAILDLSNPETPALSHVFSTGTVTRTNNADLTKDKEIALTETFTGRREADGITWVSDTVVAIANEGDTEKGIDGIYPGARGFSLFDTSGNVIFEGFDMTERHAVLYGHYPDSRSAKKGVEIEGVAAATFGGTPMLFVGSERGSFIEVYSVDTVSNPQFMQLLPTGMSPEGLLTITSRNDQKQLLVSANETDGSISIFQYHPLLPTNTQEAQLNANDIDTPWGALSGLTTDGTKIYAVADNAFAQSRIYSINPANAGKGSMVIETVTMLTTDGSTPLKVDPEGIARVTDGFWVACEGSDVSKNELIKVDADGIVQIRVTLPPSVQAQFSSSAISTGFEGVAASSDGKTLYIVVQRGFDPALPFAAILKYDVTADTWVSATYPLDQHSIDPVLYWTGVSEIQLGSDGKLLVLERDKGGGENGAATAEIKRIYSVNPAEITEGALVNKTLTNDLVVNHQCILEKYEGMVIFDKNLWVMNDNDGGGWTQMINTSWKPKFPWPMFLPAITKTAGSH